MSLPELIRTARCELGMTQMELAHLASISIASIQNIERGRANPALSTLTEILAVLGYKINTTKENTDWDLLVRCGLPLTDINQKMTVLPSAALLARELSRACREDLDDRQYDAVCALLEAIQQHYPKTFNSHFNGDLFKNFMKAGDPKRLRKLRRIALDTIAGYL